MKALIWIACIFVYSLIVTVLKQGGITLGAIPAIIVFGATMWLAKTLCKEWDRHKGISVESDYLEEDPNRMTECKSCGYRDKNFFNACPKCGQYAKRYVYLNEELPVDNDKIRFCRKCGEELIDSSKFCRKCGTEIVEGSDGTISELENCEFCKKCGADITNDSNICHVCGEQKDNE